MTPALFILLNKCLWTTLPTDLMSGSKDQCHICINICDSTVRTAVVSQREYQRISFSGNQLSFVLDEINLTYKAAVIRPLDGDTLVTYRPSLNLPFTSKPLEKMAMT